MIFRRFFVAISDIPEPNTFATFFANLCIMTSAYGLSRTRYYRIGTVIAITIVLVGIYLQVIDRAHNDPQHLGETAVWSLGMSDWWLNCFMAHHAVVGRQLQLRVICTAVYYFGFAVGAGTVRA